jgi:hypothetical protein
MITILKNLINDKSRGVKSYFNGLTDEEKKLILEVESKEININDIKFDNKMTILKETFGISRNLPLNSTIRRDNLIDVKRFEKENEEQIVQKKIEIEESSISENITNNNNQINEDHKEEENENEKEIENEKKIENQNEDENENEDDELIDLVSNKVNKNEVKNKSLNDKEDEYNLGYNKVSKNETKVEETENENNIENETQDELIDNNNTTYEDKYNDNEKLLDNK